jgi:hypothetical protein
MMPVVTPAPSSARPPRVTRIPAPIRGEVPPAPVEGVELVVAVVGVGRDAVSMQADASMVSPMRVTSPVPANTRPCTVTPEPRVIEVEAMTVPTKV